MGKIWKLSNTADFKEAGRNLFIITLSIEENKQWILVGKPWLFDNYLFALLPLEGNKQLPKAKFETE